MLSPFAKRFLFSASMPNASAITFILFALRFEVAGEFVQVLCYLRAEAANLFCQSAGVSGQGVFLNALSGLIVQITQKRLIGEQKHFLFVARQQ